MWEDLLSHGVQCLVQILLTTSAAGSATVAVAAVPAAALLVVAAAAALAAVVVVAVAAAADPEPPAAGFVELNLVETVAAAGEMHAAVAEAPGAAAVILAAADV